ncbi:MAG: hypothetical protein WBZ36_07830 [Candidatus Nitrosopolaris sp.]
MNYTIAAASQAYAACGLGLVAHGSQDLWKGSGTAFCVIHC